MPIFPENFFLHIVKLSKSTASIKSDTQLNEKYQKQFHSHVIRCMFLCKRGRPDVAPRISFLTARVNKSCQGDWRNLKKILFFLKRSLKDVLTFKVGDKQIIHWYVDASFAVHDNFKSHSGACMKLGQGMISNHSTKQKSNSRSSTEPEKIGVDNRISKIISGK